MLNYSYQRIKQLMQDDYGITLTKIWGYKSNRYHPTLYRMTDTNGNLIETNITLDALRLLLTKEGYPLKS